MSLVNLTITVVNRTAETFTLQGFSPSTGDWVTQPPATIGPNSSASMAAQNTISSIHARVDYSGTVAGQSASFRVTADILTVGSNVYTASSNPASALIVSHNNPGGYSPHVTFTVADALHDGDVISFRSLSSKGSHVFMNGNNKEGTVSMVSTYDSSSSHGVMWTLRQTPGNANTWYLSSQGDPDHPAMYLSGNTTKGTVELTASYDPDDAYMNWVLIPIVGQNGIYQIQCAESGKTYRWLDCDTEKANVFLSEKWSASNASESWAVFNGVAQS